MKTIDTLGRINQLQRQLIIHSTLYYLYDDPLWTDEKYDKATLELLSLMNTPEWEQSVYYKGFADFDGSTGMHLPYIDYTYAVRKTRQLLDYNQQLINNIKNN